MKSVVRDTVKVELVEVKDARYDKPHYLSLTTTCKSTDFFHDDGRLHWSSATIELDAVYFAGPASSVLGQRVCVMGGSTQHVDKVKLTNGGVVINVESLKGLHIGSLMFGRIVDWAKQFPGHWCIVPIGLSVIDARTPDAKQRRNRFYENFGIRFQYARCDGIDDAVGSSDPALTVAELVPRVSWTNITMLGHWGSALQAQLRRLDTPAAELRRARRLARVYQRRLGSVEHRLRQIGAGITWVLVGVAGVLGYALGHVLQ